MSTEMTYEVAALSLAGPAALPYAVQTGFKTFRQAETTANKLNRSAHGVRYFARAAKVS